MKKMMRTGDDGIKCKVDHTEDARPTSVPSESSERRQPAENV